MVTNDQGAPLVVVCDAGPLIHLDEVGCLDLLADFSQVLVPDAVWQEVRKHRPRVLQEPLVKFYRAECPMPCSSELDALSLVFSLHRGEREAIQVAIGNPGSILLTDDTAARLAAGNLEITCHGTLGILVRAIRRKQRSKEEILEVLRALPSRSTLHLRRSLLEAVIGEVESRT